MPVLRDAERLLAATYRRLFEVFQHVAGVDDEPRAALPPSAQQLAKYPVPAASASAASASAASSSAASSSAASSSAASGYVSLWKGDGMGGAKGVGPYIVAARVIPLPLPSDWKINTEAIKVGKPIKANTGKTLIKPVKKVGKGSITSFFAPVVGKK